DRIRHDAVGKHRLPSRFKVSGAQRIPPASAYDVMAVMCILSKEQGERLRVSEGIDQWHRNRLADRGRPVEGARVTPVLQGVLSRQMPLGGRGCFVLVRSEMDR